MREKEITNERIRHLDLDAPICVEAGTFVGEVVVRMQKERKSCVLVCSGERCVGIFTERDFVNRVLAKGVSLSDPVDRFMSPDPRTLTVDDTLAQAIQIMHEYGYRNIPLVDQRGNCAGLLQIRDIIDFLAELYPEEVLNAPPRSDQKFEAPDGA